MEINMKELFKGSCVALITPFKKNKIDYEKLGEMIDFQLVAGTSAILILGTTGESATITYDERIEMIKFCRNRIGNNCKMLVGAGSNSTRTTIGLCQTAEKYGADGLLVVTPYYNKCNQNGLLCHYGTIANSVHIPIIIYNVPSRTGVNICPETAEKISHIDNIVGIKEANSDLIHIDKMCEALKNKMAIYSGNDDLNLYFLKRGASGVISVTANLFPELVNEVCKDYFDGKISLAENLHNDLQKVNRAMFVDVNPIPVKYGASYMKLCDNELRLPLTPLSFDKLHYVKDSIDEIKNLNK